MLAINIRLIAITTAAIMTSKWSTIPTAVITESSEKMASSTTIVSPPPELRTFALRGVIAVFPLQPFVQLHRGFEQQKETTKQHD